MKTNDEILKERCDNFIKKSKIIHNNKYDYSKVEYKNIFTKVCIICSEHGEFWQQPNNHQNGSGCPLCKKKSLSNLNRKDVNLFIKESNKIHNNKYNYSKVEYTKNNIKVCIICPEHGEFFQTPNSHLQGHGCPMCQNNQTKNTQKFVNESKQIHINKYDYSKVEYINNHTKVCIICPEHGEFWMTPKNHLIQKQGCPKCGYKKRNEKNTSNNENFIRKAKQIHNNKYDYSNVVYIKNNIKVNIICPIHGDFYQTPHDHLQSYGCPKCGGNNKKTNEIFIKESNIIHNNKYDYSKVEYINANTKVCIICPEHGEFYQTPITHINNHGCPFCKIKKLEEILIKPFNKNNIYTERQKRFKWLGKQSLDFYLPEYNIAIECQGIQHFKPIDFFGGIDKLKYQRQLDLRKKQLCEENNVKLIYFIKK